MNQNPFLVYDETVLLKKAIQKVPTKRLLKLLDKIRKAGCCDREPNHWHYYRLKDINFLRVKRELAKREHVE